MTNTTETIDLLSPRLYRCVLRWTSAEHGPSNVVGHGSTEQAARDAARKLKARSGL